MKRLDEILDEYSSGDYYAFHMPGHKRQLSGMRGSNPFSVDITEINGFDNLHHPEGILKDAMERASQYYGSNKTFYSVNGSTGAILSAISACTKYGDKILIGRNCHKAVYHGVYLRGLEAVYVYPQILEKYGLNGGLRVEDVRLLLERHNGDLRQNPACELKRGQGIQAVVITSPTYDGMVSDVAGIAKVCHEYRIPLIIDEAHGAHFIGSNYFPKQALDLGADIVIHSVHKTLLSLTQTALLHVNSDLVDLHRIELFLGIYQTSSPSYVLMASIDSCIGLLEARGQELFGAFINNLEWCRAQLAQCETIQCVSDSCIGQNGIYDMDRSKIILWLGNTRMTGKEFHDIVRKKCHLEFEMESLKYVLALTSIGDTREGFERLVSAIKEMDQLCPKAREQLDICGHDQVEGFRRNQYTELESVLTITEALNSSQVMASMEESVGKIAAEFLYMYPPGIPLVVPGERISKELLAQIQEIKDAGFALQGSADYTGRFLSVVEKTDKI